MLRATFYVLQAIPVVFTKFIRLPFTVHNRLCAHASNEIFHSVAQFLRWNGVNFTRDELFEGCDDAEKGEFYALFQESVQEYRIPQDMVRTLP